MIELIEPIHHHEFSEILNDMHRLRARVFRERLDWDVTVNDGLEIDHYDALGPTYLLSRVDGQVQGCVRLLPTTGANMLSDIFPFLLDGAATPRDAEVWESSRFALEYLPGAARTGSGLANATFELFAGMIEFGLSQSLKAIVTVTDVRIERILKRARWPLQRLGTPHAVGSTLAVAGSLEVSHDALWQLRQACGIGRRVLWAPVDFPEDAGGSRS